MAGIKHSKVATLPQNPLKEVSRDEWNAEHPIDDASIPMAKLSDHNKTIHDALGIDATTLEGSTKTQVQTHTPATHGNEVHTSTFITQGAIDTHAGLPDVHHPRSHDHSNVLDGSPIALSGIPSTLTGKDADTLDTYHAVSLEKVANKDAASGYAGLSAASKLATAEMPTANIVTTLTFHVVAALTTGQKTMRLLAPCALTLTKVRLVIDTAPTGANVIIDVHTGTGAGTTIFTTQGNRPTIVAGAKTGVSAAPDVTVVAEADEFSVYVDQIGSTIAGSDLTIEVVGTQAVVFS
jgi:hypothetical protein